MNVPLPGIKEPVGLGQIVSVVLTAVFGITPCPACVARAGKLSQLLTFTPPKGAAK